MVSLAYNMGVSGMRQTTFAQYVKRGQYEAAAESLLHTGTSPQNKKVSKGLKNRRMREKKWLEKDITKSQKLNSKIKFQTQFPY